MLEELLRGFFALCTYFAAAATLILVVKHLVHPPREYVRKLMHTVCFLSIFVLTGAFDVWYLAVGACALLALIIYPALALAEKHPRYAALFNERSKGEVKNSMVLVFLMMAVMIAIFWGVLGEGFKYITVVAILAWGFGDAAAALVGQKFGRHQVTIPLAEQRKTWEGTFAMFVVAFLAIFVSLLIYATLRWYLCLPVALAVAAVSAFTELVSRKGRDTINVPFATALPLFLLVYFLS